LARILLFLFVKQKTPNAAGVDMKTVIIGIAMAVCFSMGFTVSESEKYPPSGSMPGMSIEKAYASESAPNTLELHKQSVQDASILSWTTILYLGAAVIVIISIRRNTYV
jgi:hypothetical protein